MLYLVILLCFVFFAGVAMTINEGLWSNSVLLLVVLLGGILAFSVGAPLGSFAAEKVDAGEDYTWHVVFACVWGVFFLSVTIMRILLEKASRTRLRFVPLLEMIAGPLMGLFVAIMFTSFAAYTLDRIPIQAGHWSTGDASSWQISFFQYARAPFLNVISQFAATEGLSSPIIAP